MLHFLAHEQRFPRTMSALEHEPAAASSAPGHPHPQLL